MIDYIFTHLKQLEAENMQIIFSYFIIGSNNVNFIKLGLYTVLCIISSLDEFRDNLCVRCFPVESTVMSSHLEHKMAS